MASSVDRTPRSMRVIVLGNEMAGDDGAALRVARELDWPARTEVAILGRPGAGLLDHLDGEIPTVIVDMIRRGPPPGTVVTLGLAELVDRGLPGDLVSSHGFGAIEGLRLYRALGRALPKGFFVGLVGSSFEPGMTSSPTVAAAIASFSDAILDAVGALGTA